MRHILDNFNAETTIHIQKRMYEMRSKDAGLITNRQVTSSLSVATKSSWVLSHVKVESVFTVLQLLSCCVIVALCCCCSGPKTPIPFLPMIL